MGQFRLLLPARRRWALARRAADCVLYASYALFAVGLVGTVFLPGTVYLYYLAALVPAAIVLALPLFASPAPLARVSVLMLFGFYALFYVGLDQAGKSADRRASVAHLSQAIAPFVDPDHLNNALETNALGVDQSGEVARVLATHPSVIVTANDPLTRQNATAGQLVRNALQSDYEPLASAKLGERTVQAWRRR